MRRRFHAWGIGNEVSGIGKKSTRDYMADGTNVGRE